MFRRVFTSKLIGLLLGTAGWMAAQDASSGEYDSWGANLIAFNNLFCRYFKKYWGCLPEETNPKRCRPILGERDYKLEEEMIRAWDKLIKKN